MAWIDDANDLIGWIDKQLPPDADLKARKRALREHAWKLHQGTSWGKKVWSRASRAYLERHGLPKRTVEQAVHLSPLERLMLNQRAALSAQRHIPRSQPQTTLAPEALPPEHLKPL